MWKTYKRKALSHMEKCKIIKQNSENVFRFILSCTESQLGR